jgi:hypothetical protein
MKATKEEQQFYAEIVKQQKSRIIPLEQIKRFKLKGERIMKKTKIHVRGYKMPARKIKAYRVQSYKRRR